MREQPLALDGLGHRRRLGRGDAVPLGLAGDALARLARGGRCRGMCELAAGARGSSWRWVVALLALVRLDRPGGRLQLAEVALRDRVQLRDPAETPVRVLVAVHVLEHDVAADPLRDADLLDDPIVDGDDWSAAAGVDVNALALVVGADDFCGVGAALDALDGVGLGETVRITGARLYRKVPLGQAGERADEVSG